MFSIYIENYVTLLVIMYYNTPAISNQEAKFEEHEAKSSTQQ